MGFGRKFKRKGPAPRPRVEHEPFPAPRSETPEQMRFRLEGEATCRRIADQIATMLPASRGFILITADYGGGNEPFSNTHYVARMHREDAARLMSETVDTWRSAGLAVEPTAATATFIREAVYNQMRGIEASTIAAMMTDSTAEVQRAVAADDPRAAITAAGTLAVEALAIFDRYMPRALAKPKAEGAN
jgi:hypothetical protein